MKFKIVGRTRDEPHLNEHNLYEQFDLLFQEVGLAAYSVLDKDGAPASFIAYTAFIPPNMIAFFSSGVSEHVAFLKRDSRFSCTIWETPLEHGEGLRGAQLFGALYTLDNATRKLCVERYGARFPSTVTNGLIEKLKCLDDVGGEIICLQIKRAKLLFEPAFGRRNFISVTF